MLYLFYFHILACTKRRSLISKDTIICKPSESEGFPEESYRLQRVCDICYQDLEAIQEELRHLQELKIDPDNVINSVFSSFNFQLENEIANATRTLQSFYSSESMNIADGHVPRSLMRDAQSFAFFSVLKAGFLFSGRYGTGFILSRLSDGTWSAPAALCISVLVD